MGVPAFGGAHGEFAATPASGGASRARAMVIAATALTLVVASTVAFQLSGDRDDTDNAAFVDPSATETIYEDTTTTEYVAPAAPFTAKFQWTWTFRTDNGYTQSGTVKVGAVSRLEKAPALGGVSAATILGGCDSDEFDETTDAVIPTAIELTNTTKSFSNKLGVTLYRAYRASQRQPLSVVAAARSYTSGPSCELVSTANDAFFSEGSGWSVGWESVEAGGSRGPHYGFLIIRDYYSPNHPTGNADLYDDSLLAIVPNMRSDDAKLTSFSGSGIPAGYFEEVSKGFLVTVAMPLDGSMPTKD